MNKNEAIDFINNLEDVKITSIEYEPEYEHKLGDIYQLDNDEYYILSNVNYQKITLIGLRSGNRWCEPITVDKAWKITNKDFKRLIRNDGFKKVDKDCIFKIKW